MGGYQIILQYEFRHGIGRYPVPAFIGVLVTGMNPELHIGFTLKGLKQVQLHEYRCRRNIGTTFLEVGERGVVR